MLELGKSCGCFKNSCLRFNSYCKCVKHLKEAKCASPRGRAEEWSGLAVCLVKKGVGVADVV